MADTKKSTKKEPFGGKKAAPFGSKEKEAKKPASKDKK